MSVGNGVLTYYVGMQRKTIDLQAYFNTDDGTGNFAFHDLVAVKVISNFNDLYVGDLAFLSMAIGMNNLSGAHCIHCTKRAHQFNSVIEPHKVRTKASLTQCLNRYVEDSLRVKSVRNHLGVNSVALIDIDPKRIIAPILHCPMGLVDKVLEVFKAFTALEFELLPPEAEVTRAAFKSTKGLEAAAINHEIDMRILANESRIPETAALYRLAKEATQTASRKEKQTRKEYEDMVKNHNSWLYSLSQDFDAIFQSNGIKKEHYHGGKYNGVNCIRIMEKSEALFNGFADAIKGKKIATVTDEDITLKCDKFARLLSLMDVIWSNVRGIDAGLLPTENQIAQLETALNRAKAMWLEMNIKTLQPKWHLTFDGHLLHQVRTYGGIADKADDTIEFQHQILKKLRDRYRSITSYQRRECCIRRELRRIKSPEMQGHIDRHERSIKVNKGSKRAVANTERQQEHREAKRVKREAILE